MRILWAILLIGLLIAGAVYLADRPGTVELTWQGWQIETSVALLLLGVVLFAFAFAVVLRLLRLILRGPRLYARYRRDSRRRRGYRALSQGMVAVAAGDAAEAKRFAKQADALLAEPPLTLLLSAQAAQLNGDETAAAKYFTAMLDRPETEFLGLRGLIMQALKRNDEAAALALIERARALRPKAQWVLQSMVELQARAGQWQDAESTLAVAAQRKAVPVGDGRRHRAAILFEEAHIAEADDRPRDAARLLGKAHAAAPGFVPAAARYAELLTAQGQKRHARKVIEATWALTPHPDLARAAHALYADERPVQRLKRLAALMARNEDHIESRLALAEAALEAQLWGEARRHLVAAGGREDNPAPSPRICRAMAELEEAEHGDLPAARMWLARAVSTPAQDPAYRCGICGAEVARWSAVCPHCRSFDTIDWRLPGEGRALVPTLAGAASAGAPRVAADPRLSLPTAAEPGALGP